MKILKEILKVLVCLAAGIAFGLLIAVVMIMLFADMSFEELAVKFQNVNITDGMVAVVISVVSLAVSFLLSVIIHEGGHLVCGLASGYRFVSFRIFNIVFIRQNDKLAIKHFAVAGTGGQCLLSPPDLPINDIPTGWYNAGGVLANVVVMLAVLPLLWTDCGAVMREIVVVFCVVSLFVILLNGIPMKAGGLGNDAYNMMKLRDDTEGKRGVVMQLRSNALMQNGIRPKDMPAEWFTLPGIIDYSNPLQVSLPIMAASRALDMMEWENAYNCFESIYAHKDEVVALYVKEIECELLFLAMVTGRESRAQELWTPELRKYIEGYKSFMSSKVRILAGVALFIEHDRQKAMKIFEDLRLKADGYLLQGEVKSDIAIMERVFEMSPTGV